MRHTHKPRSRPVPGIERRRVPDYIAEFVGTFILVLTVLLVIHRNAAPGFAGVAIGLGVFAAITPVATATGASINPARTLGPMFIQTLWGGDVEWGQAPVYLAAEFAAGAVAALAYLALTKIREVPERVPAVTTTEPESERASA